MLRFPALAALPLCLVLSEARAQPVSVGVDSVSAADGDTVSVAIGMANPLAALLSFAMALRYSLDMAGEAELIERATEKVLDGGLRTADIMQPGKAKVSTSVMGESIIRALDKDEQAA